MRITRWGEYGILCCIYLAQRGAKEPVGAAEIAEGQHIPTQYAQQILHRLRKGEIIKSVRGPRGGFLLSRPTTEINLREILLAAEGHTFELICEDDPVHHDACSQGQDCGLRPVWEELQSAVNSLLEGKTLAAVVEAHRESSIGALVPSPHRKSDAPSEGSAASIDKRAKNLKLSEDPEIDLSSRAQ